MVTSLFILEQQCTPSLTQNHGYRLHKPNATTRSWSSVFAVVSLVAGLAGNSSSEGIPPEHHSQLVTTRLVVKKKKKKVSKRN